MRILISSIGSRGDVQPIIALAIALRARGHDPRLCAAPNFKEWVESFGLPCVPIGPDLKQLTGGTVPKNPSRPSPEQLRQLAAHTVHSQFPVLTSAAQGCDLLIAAGALQLATRSVAEALRIPYVFAAYCPAVLPSPSHPPAKMGAHHPQSLGSEANEALWSEEARSWNGLFRDALNEERAQLGLDPIEAVQRHIFTEHPWLAADALLGPPGANAELEITQTGAWLLDDPRPLPDHIEEFLARGEPPVYFGFGSMRVLQGSNRSLIESARAVGRRSIISQGWGNLAPIDDASDCLSVDDVSHEALFARVEAIVHHGGAGTTTAAARSGKPQVIVPHHYDQFYWAHRIQELGVGAVGPTRDELTLSAMTRALHEALQPDVKVRAVKLGPRIELRGAQSAADQLTAQFG